MVADDLRLEVCSLLNPTAIYANNCINLSNTEVFGFEYTLAQHKDVLHPKIPSAAQGLLAEHCKYPEGIQKHDYDHSLPSVASTTTFRKVLR